MSEMIERVARALRKQFAGIGNDIPGFGIMDDYRGEIVGDWRDMARAAIEEMREPTPDMIKSGSDAVYEAGGPPTEASDKQAAAAWRSMIDEALK